MSRHPLPCTSQIDSGNCLEARGMAVMSTCFLNGLRNFLMPACIGIFVCASASGSQAFLATPRVQLDARASQHTGSYSARPRYFPESLPVKPISVSAGLITFFALSAFASGAGRRPRRTRAVLPAARRSTVVACRAGTSQAIPVLRLGTRASPLALAQAHEAKRRLAEAFPELAEDGAVEIRAMSTTGDERLEISLAEVGGKGLFTKELDEALASKAVDFCVHSTKDVPTTLIPNTELITMLPREDTRDVIISKDPSVTRIEDLPSGSVIGTASLRRQAQIYAKNPGVKCVNFRGNVQTRLKKLGAGEVDATLLAYAGLKRMNMEHHATRVLEWDEILPAISQGAISFQCRSDDKKTLGYLAALNDVPTMQAVTCERAFLAVLDGNCKTPIAGQARVVDDWIHFHGLVASPDGQRVYTVDRMGPAADAAAIGHFAGVEVRQQAGEKFFEEMQEYVQDMQAANTKPVRDAMQS